MSETRKIYCCGCGGKVSAKLTDGSKIYPHRPDLGNLPFWLCSTCGNYVGCHHKTKDRTRPLGDIPTREVRNARQHIHRILDPLWKSGRFRRGEIYQMISNRIGYQFHTAEILSVQQAREVYRIIQEIAKG